MALTWGPTARIWPWAPAAAAVSSCGRLVSPRLEVLLLGVVLLCAWFDPVIKVPKVLTEYLTINITDRYKQNSANLMIDNRKQCIENFLINRIIFFIHLNLSIQVIFYFNEKNSPKNPNKLKKCSHRKDHDYSLSLLFCIIM